MRPLLAALALLLLAPAVAGAVSVTPAAAPEGDGKLVFTLRSDAPLGEVVLVSTRDGSAKGGEDFTPVTARQVSVPAGAAGTTVEVTVRDDDRLEFDEAFELTVTPLPAGTAATAPGTIRNDEAPPFAAAIAAPVVEGADGTATVARLTVGLLAPTTKPVSVRYATAPGSATTPADFAGLSGTIVLPPGEQVRTIEVPVRGDDVFEGPHGFELRLDDPVNATLPEPVLAVAITEDDPQPTLTAIGAPAADEGSRRDTFTGALLRLSSPAEVPVSVAVATRDGSARAPADYTPVRTVVTFAPGETDKVALVVVKADRVRERTELLDLLLTGAANVTVPGGTLTLPLTIRDDDRARDVPAISVGAPRLSNGRVLVRVRCPRGEARCRLTVTLRRAGRRVGRPARLTLTGGASRSARIRVPAFARRGRITATVVATDADGNRTTRRRSATLR